MDEQKTAVESAKDVLARRAQLDQERDALVASLNATIEECKAALAELGAEPVSSGRTRKRKPGRPKGSKNKPAETPQEPTA